MSALNDIPVKSLQICFLLTIFIHSLLTAVFHPLRLASSGFHLRLQAASTLFDVMRTLYVGVRTVAYMSGRWEIWWSVSKIVLEACM